MNVKRLQALRLKAEIQRRSVLARLLKDWKWIEFEHESAQETDQSTQEDGDEDDSSAYRGA